MATTQPTLGGVTLPYPMAEGGFEVEVEYRGGQRVMADGTTVVDLVNTNAKYSFTLRWKGLASADVAAIQNGYFAIRLAPGTFVSPAGASYTVSHHPDSRRLTISAVYVAPGTLRNDVSMRLREE